jgi:hypothetical protein
MLHCMLGSRSLYAPLGSPGPVVSLVTRTALHTYRAHDKERQLGMERLVSSEGLSIFLRPNSASARPVMHDSSYMVALWRIDR